MRLCFSIILIFSFSYLNSQFTVGTLYLDSLLVQDGHTLFYPNNQSSVYLIDNCGALINEWKLSEGSFAGAVAKMDSHANLFVASANSTLVNQSSFGAGGAGGVIEKYDRNNTLIWRHIAADSLQRQHHDFEILPNGNILYIVWQRHFLDEIVSMGFDTVTHPQREIWSDSVLEYDPLLDQIVWQWNSWDHIVQDYDENSSNYGDVSQSLGRIDLNYQDYSFGRQDWLHSNGISYLEERDQIVLSVRNFNEIWIIDHSTTIEEAATSEGGVSGKGGELLYRWGDSNTYQEDSFDVQRRSFWQHDPDWVLTDNGEQGILFFNNFLDEERSEGQLILPVFDAESQTYQLAQDSTEYLPLHPIETYSHPQQEKTFSTAASSIQKLPNGNILMCAARQGRIFEITMEGNLVWEYLVPLKAGIPIDQGFELSLSDNFTFQAHKYPISYSDEFITDSTTTIEVGSLPSYCDQISSNSNFKNHDQIATIQPNPILDEVLRVAVKDSVDYFDTGYEIYTLSGSPLLRGVFDHDLTIDVSTLEAGIYLLRLQGELLKFAKL